MTGNFNKIFGLSLVLAGSFIALWATSHPWGTIAGPEVGGSTQWAFSHTCHFLGGFFASIGLLGLLGRQFDGAGKLEQAGFFITFVGTLMYTATGVITAFIWPLLADHAPQMTELSGPIFSPPHPVIAITALAFSLGFSLLFIALARAGLLSKISAAIFVAGALLLVPPPPPLSQVPWVIFPIGGLVLGIGVIRIGTIVLTGFEDRQLTVDVVPD